LRVAAATTRLGEKQWGKPGENTTVGGLSRNNRGNNADNTMTTTAAMRKK